MNRFGFADTSHPKRPALLDSISGKVCAIYTGLQTVGVHHRIRIQTLLLVIATLALAVFSGMHASSLLLRLLIALGAGVVVLRRPVLGLPAVVLAALLVQLGFGTGTAVALNPVTLLVPVLLGFWLLDMVHRQALHMVPSRTTAPLFLFLLCGLLSLLAGNALWDPAVPRPTDFTLVQLSQWAIFAFSAGIFWMAGNLLREHRWLERVSFLFLAVAGTLGILMVLSRLLGLGWLDSALSRLVTHALHRAPFWLLLAAVAGGQLLFNRELTSGWRALSMAALAAVLAYAFHLERETASNWVGVGAVLGVLAWLRFPRLRRPVIILGGVLIAAGWASSAVYSFAGGDAEWVESGGSRLLLIGRVVEVTMRNPVTGLGPAAYRAYARTRPLLYYGALWLDPQVSSHNNYVDLFSHVGLLGLGLFAWFAVELVRLGLRLRKPFTAGFAAGYVNGMLAAWAGSLVLMLFADWILPFVYNIGFPGFQASVLVWLFLGGLVALENTSEEATQ